MTSVPLSSCGTGAWPANHSDIHSHRNSEQTSLNVGQLPSLGAKSRKQIKAHYDWVSTRKLDPPINYRILEMGYLLQDMEIPFSQSVSQSKQYPSAVIGFTRKGNQGLRHEYSMVKWFYKNIDNHHFECPFECPLRSTTHEYWNSNRCLTCRQTTKGRHTPPPSSTTLPRTGSKGRGFVNS